MKKKTFSPFETVLVVLLVLLLIAVPYYFFVHVPVTDGIAAANAQAADAQDQITIYNARRAKMNQMQKFIDEKKAEKGVASIQPYDNQSEVMNFLYGVLLDKTTDLVVNQSVALPTSGYVVRRNISISFKCATLGVAEKIVQELEAGSFLSQITVLSFAPVRGTNPDGTRTNLLDEDVNANISITFFEDNSQTK